MTVEVLDGALLSKMILLGANHLENNAKKIDALNVFPVPDGDTGTNMNLSMSSGVSEVKKLNTESVSEVADAFAKGLLMGARGNSGVILSQIFRGFSKGTENRQTLNARDLAESLDQARATAYKAVMKPVEGTILTVIKDAAKEALTASETETDVVVLMERVLNAAKISLKRTPELLPVLKEVGVVDSGGQGLVVILEGFLAALKGEPLPEETADIEMQELVNAQHHQIAQTFMDTSEIEFGYCTEFIVKFEDKKIANNPFSEDSFRSELSEYGDSLVVVSDDDIVKVHIHSEEPGTCLSLGQQYGSLTNIKIENMREQHTAIVGEQNTEKATKDYAIITVAMGSGLKKLFESIGATTVIEGGQTMNPSTQDIASAITKANAKNVLILPNNKNIWMAADQAAEIADVNAAVVPTKTIPQGISAMLAFNPEASISENQAAMKEAGKAVKTGQITYAVRDTQIDGMEIEKDSFMGIEDGKIVVSHPDRITSTKQLLQHMISEDDELLTVFSGEGISEEETNEIVNFVEETFEAIEVEVHHGNQPIYSYIFSVE